jgi:hypothetical protein
MVLITNSMCGLHSVSHTSMILPIVWNDTTIFEGTTHLYVVYSSDPDFHSKFHMRLGLSLGITEQVSYLESTNVLNGFNAAVIFNASSFHFAM